MNLLKDKESLEVFRVVDQDRHTVGELVDRLSYDKQTISKYVSHMEISGIIRGEWEQGADKRWRRYYHSTDFEWSRLLREILVAEKSHNVERHT